MSYKRKFSPSNNNVKYIFSENIILAINVALATGRPLLVRGVPGSGKSSLAESVASHLEWNYYKEVITSKTQSQDLLWQFDALRRLNDAQAQQIKENAAYYINPGILWLAYDPESAATMGVAQSNVNNESQDSKIEEGQENAKRAVVLIDEIDKADPDLPNNLLVPIESLSFKVQEINFLVKAENPPLVIITTNEERELPKAFLRRCIILTLERPNEKMLLDIASVHFGGKNDSLYKKIYSIMNNPEGSNKKTQNLPSTAEYIDTIKTCLELKIDHDDPILDDISKMSLFKQFNPL